MTKREIKKRIYLTHCHSGYEVICNIPGSGFSCYTDSYKVGNAIVRALRELAEKEIKK